MRTERMFVTGFVAAVAMAGCQAKPASVEVTPQKVQLTDETTSETLKIAVKDAAGKPIEKFQAAWTSSETAVATVDATGKVTAVGSGMTTVTAKVGEISGSAPVAVQIIKTVKVEPATVEVEMGGAPVQVRAVFMNDKGEVLASASKTPKWSVQDPAIATIGDDGTLTAVAAGNTTVKVNAGAGFDAQASVLVKPAPVPADGAPLQ